MMIKPVVDVISDVLNMISDVVNELMEVVFHVATAQGNQRSR